MTMTEVRNRKEGTLRWVEASGAGPTWLTASAPVSGLIGFARGFTLNSARTTYQVMDGGVPNHTKDLGAGSIQVTFDLAWGVTAQYPSVVGTGGGGHSVAGLIHLEYRATAAEAGSGSALYMRVHGVTINSLAFADGDQENTQNFTCVGLGMCGPTASGYLA